MSFFALVGGHTAEIITRRMLGQAMTNSLACHFNWAGKGQKRAFKNTVLHDVMFGKLKVGCAIKEQVIEHCIFHNTVFAQLCVIGQPSVWLK